jgi:thiol-disulfide isomerase/thioredoxin
VCEPDVTVCADGYTLKNNECVPLFSNKNYPIVISIGSLKAGSLEAANYEFKFEHGKLEVTGVPAGVSGTSDAFQVGGINAGCTCAEAAGHCDCGAASSCSDPACSVHHSHAVDQTSANNKAVAGKNEFDMTLYTEKEQIPLDRLLTLDGEQYSGEELRGKYTLVTFWATWCPYCRGEMPSKQRLYDNYTRENFTVLLVNVGEDTETIANFMSKNFFDIPVVRDANNELKATYANGIPTSYILDPEGNIIARINGSKEWDSEQALKTLNNLTGAVNSESSEQVTVNR